MRLLEPLEVRLPETVGILEPVAEQPVDADVGEPEDERPGPERGAFRSEEDVRHSAQHDGDILA